MTLEEMIEERANHMFAGKNRTQDELDAARDVIVLEYAERNWVAVKGLVEGRAAVIPTDRGEYLVGELARIRLDQGSGE